MISAKKQLAEMVTELQSRSNVKIILESDSFEILSSLMLVGNFITLLVMLLNRNRRTIPYLLVTSLVVTIICLAVFVSSPVGPVVLVTSKWHFNNSTCQFHGYFVIMLTAASIHTLVLMAVNGYFKPSKYRRYFTQRKTQIMILVSWLSSMCTPLPYFLNGYKMVFHPSKFFCYGL